jgi:hypothetical protein
LTQDWIATLAQDIKQKNHDAANEYGRAQHRAGVVADRGPTFFAEVVTCLQQNVTELRSELQGDTTSADTNVQSVSVQQLKLTRSRFPWVDATLTHEQAAIVLTYAKGIGTPADPTVAPNRTTRTFTLLTAPDDTLYAEDAFTAPPVQYPQPQDLARRITEILFSV